jgi:hypothetical protein
LRLGTLSKKTKETKEERGFLNPFVWIYELSDLDSHRLMWEVLSLKTIGVEIDFKDYHTLCGSFFPHYENDFDSFHSTCGDSSVQEKRPKRIVK